MRLLALAVLVATLFASGAQALIDPVRSLSPVAFSEHEVGSGPVSVLWLPSGEVVRAAGTTPFDGRFDVVNFHGTDRGVSIGYTPVGMFTFGDGIVNLVGYDRSSSFIERRTVSWSLSLARLDAPSRPAGACAAEGQQFFAWGGLPAAPWVGRFTLSGARVWVVSGAALASVSRVESVGCGTGVAVAGKNDAGENRVLLVAPVGQVAWVSQPFPFLPPGVIASAAAVDAQGRPLVAYDSGPVAEAANIVLVLRFDASGMARVIASPVSPAYVLHPTALLTDSMNGFVVLSRSVSACGAIPEPLPCGGPQPDHANYERFDASGNLRATGSCVWTSGSIVLTTLVPGPTGFVASGSTTDAAGRTGVTTLIREFAQV